MNTVLQQYLDKATDIIDQFEKSHAVNIIDPHPVADVLRMGRGIITQQDAEIQHLRNMLSVKSETIKSILSNRNAKDGNTNGE